jgi:hypothetical protein
MCVQRIIITSGFVAYATIAAAQVGSLPQPPPRDRPQPPAVGTATIKGRVVDGQSGAAIARARVRLSGFQRSNGQLPSVQTDDVGAFAFSAVPAGNYSIQADKSTFLSGRYPETGETLRTNFRPLTVADGQTVDGVTVSLFHGSAIAGRVVDSHGDPLENVEVRALALPKSGNGRPQMRSGGSTNDIGEFRIARLQPGRYVLMVVPRRFDANFNEPLVADLQPLPTYYPAALSIDQAQPIAVERGASVTGVEVVALEGVSAVVSGTVTVSTGQPLRGGGSIMARPIMDAVGFGGGPIANGPVKPDGAFQLKLPPGEYQLEARVGRGPQDNGGPPLFGSIRLSVAGDVSDVGIAVGNGAKVAGRLLFDGSSPPPTSATVNVQTLRVAMNSSDGATCQSGRTTVASDWTFTVENVVGTCRIQFIGGIAKWSVKAVLHNGKDLLDQPIAFGNEDWKDIEIVFTDKRTELTLQVADEQGTTTRDYVALLFSTDRTRWSANGSRYVRPYVPPPLTATGTTAFNEMRNSSDGVLQVTPGAANTRPDIISGMPPGNYYVIAVDDLAPDSLRDVDLLEQLSRIATRITLRDDAPAQINLRRMKLATVAR